MILVNCSVYNLTGSKTVLPWSIYCSSILGISVKEIGFIPGISVHNVTHQFAFLSSRPVN